MSKENQQPNTNKTQFEKVCDLSRLFLVPDLEGSGEKVPLQLTETQKLIWFAIVTRGKYGKPFNIAITPSQYGKSEVVSCAVLLRALSNPNEKWLIVAPSTPKAEVIMGKIRGHLFDQEDFVKMIPKTFQDAREKLAHERSQKRITLSNGSSIEIKSADADAKSEGGQKLMGAGAPNLVIDESCEMNDEIYSKIFRMLGTTKAPFVMELGNPWERNHFHDSWEDTGYNQIFVDCYGALREGRFTQEFVDRMKRLPNFGVLMEGKFPDAAAQDRLGYSPVFSEGIFSLNVRKEQDIPYISGRKTIGLDVAYKGKDTNVWVMRGDNAMKVLYKSNDTNTLNVIAITMELAAQYGVADSDIYMDASGGGYIVYQEFLSRGYNINGVEFGTKPVDDIYKNIKAEGFFLLNQWLVNGGVLIDHKDWGQLRHIKYKNEGGRIKIISKEELKAQGVGSPDTADAAMLACVGGITNARTKNTQIKYKQAFQPNYL